MSHGSVVAGLDIGTTKVTVFISKINNNKDIEIIGIGECSSMGMRKGCIVDIDNAVQAIEHALNQAQKKAGIKVETVYLNTTVDPIANIGDEAITNLMKTLNRLGLGVREMVLSPVAAAEAVLVKEEKQNGAVLIDVGGGTTGIAVFENESLQFAEVLPIGGQQITSDLAFGLRVTTEQAEIIKIKYGSVMADIASEYDFCMIGENNAKRKVSRKHIADIIQPRVEEILIMAKNTIHKTERPVVEPVVVLTGGTSLLPGLKELTESIMGWQVLLAIDENVKRESQIINQPSYATGIGLNRCYMQNIIPKKTLPSLEQNENFLIKMKKWIREYI